MSHGAHSPAATRSISKTYLRWVVGVAEPLLHHFVCLNVSVNCASASET